MTAVVALGPTPFSSTKPPRWLVGKSATHALAAVSLLTIVIFGLSAEFLRQLASARDWVRHSHAVQSQIDRVTWDFDALENGLRGLVLTGADAQLAAYERLRTQIGIDAADLVSSTRDQPDQRRRADELSRVLPRQIDRMDQVVAARRAKSLEAARDLAFAIDSSPITGTIAQMREQEDRLLTARAAREQSQTQLVLAGLSFSGLLAFGMVGLAAYLVNQTARGNAELLRQQENLLAQKDLLVREVDHRVRNSLSLIHSLLWLQARGEGVDEAIRHQLADAANRVLTVSRVHEQLYKSEAVTSVEISSYLSELCNGLANSLLPSKASAAIRLNLQHAELKVGKAVSLGLIVAELVTNAMKYAAPSEAAPVEVTLAVESSTVKLTVADHGCGLAHDFSTDAGTGLGMQVVRMLVRQLNGRLEVDPAAQGARFMVTIPG